MNKNERGSRKNPIEKSSQTQNCKRYDAGWCAATDYKGLLRKDIISASQLD